VQKVLARGLLRVQVVLTLTPMGIPVKPPPGSTLSSVNAAPPQRSPNHAHAPRQQTAQSWSNSEALNSDIDWRAGEFGDPGKGSEDRPASLPADVGEAIADWLQQGRKSCECPNVCASRTPKEELCRKPLKVMLCER